MEGLKGRKGREEKRGKGRARGAFWQIKIYDYTPAPNPLQYQTNQNGNKSCQLNSHKRIP